MARNVSVRGLGDTGIEMLGIGSIARGCAVENMTFGVYVTSDGVLVQECEIANTSTAVVSSQDSPVFQDLIITNSYGGVYATVGPIISGVMIAGTVDGVTVANRSIVQNVTVMNASGTAFTVLGTGSRIEDLAVWNSTVGIEVSGDGNVLNDILLRWGLSIRLEQRRHALRVADLVRRARAPV